MAAFDFSEVNALAASFDNVAESAGKNLLAAVTVTSLKTKRDWQEPLKGSASLRGGAAAVSYTVTAGKSASGGTEIVGEIGPELTGQGPVVGMLEYGTPSTGPRGYGAAALQKNQKDFERGIEIALQVGEKKAEL